MFFLGPYYSIRRLFEPIVKIEDIKIPLSPNFSTRMLHVIYKKGYEYPERRLLRKFLNKNDIVLELGTGVGLISTICSKMVGSEKVFTFEANPLLKSTILETFSLNEVTPKLIMSAVGPNSGEKTFYIHNDFWGSSFANLTRHSIKIHVTSFNDIIHTIKPTFLIIDIEGAEYELFQDADLSSVKKIIIELHEWMIGIEKTNIVKNIILHNNFKQIEQAGCNVYYERISNV
jgi:FkbM family methyltransferase